MTIDMTDRPRAAVLQNGNFSEPGARLKVSFFTCKKYRCTVCSGTASRRKIMKSADLPRAYFGYLDPWVTFCLLTRLAGTPKLGLAPLPNPLRVGHTTIIVG
jgi:hypothetical protein